MSAFAPWQFDIALAAVRHWETGAASFGLHLGLCGSVLHKGSSENDLDVTRKASVTTDEPTLPWLCCRSCNYRDHVADLPQGVADETRVDYRCPWCGGELVWRENIRKVNDEQSISRPT